MRRRVDLGSGLVAAGAAAVVVSLFLNWYEPGLTGWESFEVVDWGLLALGVVAIAMIGSESGGARSAGSGLAWVVGAALLLVCAEIIDPPPVVPDGAGRDVGAWLGLAGALAMSAGVGLMLASISVTIDVRERERRVRVAAVDAREAAEAETATERPPDAPAEDPDRTQQIPVVKPDDEERRTP